jgi:hypothetical protein
LTPAGVVETAGTASRLAPALRPPFGPCSLIEALARLPDLRHLHLALTEDGLRVAPLFHGLYFGRPALTSGGEAFVPADRERSRLFSGDDPRALPPWVGPRFDADATLFLAPRIGVGVQLGVGAGRSWFAGLSVVIR